MRLPLARAGMREMVLLTIVFGGGAALAAAGALADWPWMWPVAAVLAAVWLGGLAFFRDPERTVPSGSDLLVAPADGLVVETVSLDHQDDIGGPARRISIFLSVFDVHINRSPCAGTVRSVQYRSGRFLDARNPDSGKLNEVNAVVIDAADGSGLVVVRQIAGLIARRIVCDVKPGDVLGAGQRIGLIKFGSRTELVVPAGSPWTAAVKVGDRARGGVTVMARKLTGSPSQGTHTHAA